MAKTLIQMYCDQMIIQIYKEDNDLSNFEKCEKLLDEILFDLKVHHVTILREGDMFGEQAILRDNIRTASVRCIHDCHFAYFTQEDFQKVYNNIMQAKLVRRHIFLKAIPLFSSLSRFQL